MTLEHDGGSAGDDLIFNGGSKTGSVLSLTRGPFPGCLQRPAFPVSPGARNTRPKPRASWRLSKKRPPKPCLPFDPRSGRQADRGLGSGRGPHPGAQGDETAMTSRSALQIGLPVRRGLRRQGDRRGSDGAMGADTGTRNLPLKEISRTVAKGAQAAVLMDRALVSVPIASACSSTSTSRPVWASARAQANPTTPAPTITVSIWTSSMVLHASGNFRNSPEEAGHNCT